MNNIKFFFQFIIFFLTPICIQAQVIKIVPENPTYNEEVTLTYYAAEGNEELKNYDGDIYVHTGLLTKESNSKKDWKKVVSDWSENLEELRLHKIENNIYELKFVISKFYGVSSTGGNIVALAFVFRNDTGTKVGKDKEGNDIYCFFQKPVFKEHPQTLETSLCFEPEWANYATVYEVNIRQYTEEGTFKAFAKHLSRLKCMGVDILWFMPIQPIGIEKRKGSLGSYYSIRDYKGINQEFGTIEDFKQLVQQAHGMGFKVILDWVANHTSRDNAWIENHPDWYVRDATGEIVAPYDWTDVAKLNYDMYYMRKEMSEAMVYWVKDIGIDGFRCDVAGEIPLDFWETIRNDLDRIKEVWMVAEDAEKTYLLNHAFNANYGWEMHHLMNTIAKKKNSPSVIFDNIKKIKEHYPKGSYPMQFITNHDENSWSGTISERLGDGQKAFAVLSFTIPGIPLIYSGQEAGLNKRLKFFEKDVIDWTNQTLIPFYTKLDELKSLNSALWNGKAGGDLMEISNDQKESVISFVRENKGNKVMTIINLSDQNKSVILNPLSREGIYINHFTGESAILSPRTKLSLKPWDYQVLVYEKENTNKIRKYIGYSTSNNTLIINTTDGDVQLRALSDAAIESEFIPLGKVNSPSNAIDEHRIIDAKTTIVEDENSIIYSTSHIQVHISKEPFHISYNYEGKKLLEEEIGYFEDKKNKGFRFLLDDNEKITGGGERVLGIDRRGKRLQLYNKPSYGYEEIADLMYYSLPVVLSSKKYMVIFDNGASGWLDIGATNKNILQFDAVGGRMSYIVVAGNSWKNLSSEYTTITGRQPLVPRWALGNITSRMGYHSQKEVNNIVEGYSRDNIPLDALVLDLYWFGKDLKGTLGNFEWYRDSFPEAEKMMYDMQQKGVHTILITEPFVLENTYKFNEVIELDLVGKTVDGKPYIYDFYFGSTSLLDIFKPETKTWFWDIYKKHSNSGVSGWWGDLGEPEVHPDDLIHINGKASEVHNLYGHEWAKMIYEGYAKDFPNIRPVILMRSGFVGSQRYGMVPWSGDVNRSWGGLSAQVEIGLTMGLQGLGYMHSDLGGFAGDYKDSELYTRWLQYGVFQPIYRTHAQEEVPAEPIFWDDKTKDIVRRFIQLRYQLTPYLYTLLFENATLGLPLMRPLLYQEDDIKLFNHTDSYLWGDNFLVAPIVKKGISAKKVYFPKGSRWFDFWSNKAYEGGTTQNIATSIENIPVFVKAGSFIPMVPLINNLGSYTSEEMIIHYYHDASISESNGKIYEDDGKSKNAIATEAYEILKINCFKKGSKLHFNMEKEGLGYNGAPELRSITLVIHNIDKKPKEILVDNEPYDQIVYDASAKKLKIIFDFSGQKMNINIKN